eukprot:gnl/TRDRNA2_/TRDRNA2_131203_c0_seq1.p1 gnl/TRDRNA2_/TRDRNA2_131203_c0~~gnl/TRDRNA2_/TRDRNA2_131203_c0_seq1.p1  ORF type:complete len:549 (+),score=78.85 gnl/TRDRNA2_/TRDRNA2_131203_c0_seq1:106-1752(+)
MILRDLLLLLVASSVVGLRPTNSPFRQQPPKITASKEPVGVPLAALQDNSSDPTRVKSVHHAKHKKSAIRHRHVSEAEDSVGFADRLARQSGAVKEHAVHLHEQSASRKWADWRPEFELIWQSYGPVLDSRHGPGIMLGYEGGKVVRDDDTGIYWLFTAEFRGQPVNAYMAIASYTAPSILGPWKRKETIVEPGQRFPMAFYNQQCNQHWCSWQNATKKAYSYAATYYCNPNILMSAPWAPIPVYDREEERWHLHFVGYKCDFRQITLCGTANIFGARSRKKGKKGIKGPWELYSKAYSRAPSGGAVADVVLGPDASPDLGGTTWGERNRTERFVDQMTTYDLGEGRGYAAFVGVNHYLATADHVSGPWTVGGAQNESISTVDSWFNENAIVTQIENPDGGTGYVAVFDTVMRESAGFGVQFSTDGLHWPSEPGVKVPVSGGVRTPLGLVQEPSGGVSLLFTRRFPDCNLVYGPPYEWQQKDNSGGVLSGSPAMCANLFAAKLDVVWRDTVSGRTVRSEAKIPVYGAATARCHVMLLLVTALGLLNSV